MDSFPRDRYDASEFIRGFDNASIDCYGSEVCICFPIANSHTSEMTVYFPECEFAPSVVLMDRARKTCCDISKLDNLVQESCEFDWRQRGLLVREYALSLAYIEVRDDLIGLEYWGSVVNTQWKAEFALSADGQWSKINF